MNYDDICDAALVAVGIVVCAFCAAVPFIAGV